MNMKGNDATTISLAGATANCGNGTLGEKACAEMIGLLSQESGGADVLIVNCQEISLQAALEELKKAIPENSMIKVMSSDLRVTRTKAFDLNVFSGGTGMGTIVLYRNDNISDIQFKSDATLSTIVSNPNKGGLINVLSIKSLNHEEYSVKTISAHLDAFSEINRRNEWCAIKAATYADVKNWNELVSSIPDLQVAGFDANTRNLFKQTSSNSEEVNLWHEEVVSPKIAPFIFAPLGGTLYSESHTYKSGLPDLIKADPKRPGYSLSGSLDFVSIQNNTESSHSGTGKFIKHYEQADVSLPLEEGTKRDHQIIISRPVNLQATSEFNKVKFYLANELKYAAPVLSQDILSMEDTDENRSCLLEIHHHYLQEKIILNKIQTIDSGMQDEQVEAPFPTESEDTFEWKAKQLARGYTGEPLSKISTSEAMDAKREILKSLAEKIEADRKNPPEPETASERSIILDILSKIPFIAKLMHRLKGGSTATYALATVDNPADLATASIIPAPIANVSVLRGIFVNTGLIAAIAEFIELPIVYISSWMLGKPCPVSMTDLGEWVYSGVLLGLTILAIAFPPAAPVVLGVSIVLGLIASVHSYINFIAQENEVKTLLMEIPQQIANVQARIKELDQKIKNSLSLIDSASIEQLNQLEEYLSALTQAEKECLDLKAKQQELNQKLEIFDNAHYLDKVVGISFSLIALIGFGFIAAGTPVGWVILSAISAVGLAYTVVRLLSPLVANMFSKSSSDELKSERTSPEEILHGLGNCATTTPQSEPQNSPSPIGLGEDNIARVSKEMEIQENAEALLVEHQEVETAEHSAEHIAPGKSS